MAGLLIWGWLIRPQHDTPSRRSISGLTRSSSTGTNAITTATVGTSPDVLAIDSGHNWLYVAAESGTLTVFDLAQPGLSSIDSEPIAAAAHTVAVDSATHRVFFPLEAGPQGTPILRIMRPASP